MIVFTICSNNYLAEALSLGQSLIVNGLSKDNFKIFLCDRYSLLIDYKSLDFEVVEISEDIVPDFLSIKLKYQIVELNTAVKPSILKYLIRNNPRMDLFCYLDPDLFFYSNVKLLETELGSSSILLTPHITKPVPLHLNQSENIFLNYGLYNLGFLLIKKNSDSKAMLDWWEERTVNRGYDDVAKGLFVDQLWINFVPIFFKNVKISTHEGLNVAYWNLNERHLIKYNSSVFVNNTQTNLVFFHFSSFDFDLQQISKKLKDEICKKEKVVLDEMAIVYKKHLIANNYFFLKKVKPAYKISFDSFIEKYLPQRRLSKFEFATLQMLRRLIPLKLLIKIAGLQHKISTIIAYEKAI